MSKKKKIAIFYLTLYPQQCSIFVHCLSNNYHIKYGKLCSQNNAHVIIGNTLFCFRQQVNKIHGTCNIMRRLNNIVMMITFFIFLFRSLARLNRVCFHLDIDKNNNKIILYKATHAILCLYLFLHFYELTVYYFRNTITLNLYIRFVL